MGGSERRLDARIPRSDVRLLNCRDGDFPLGEAFCFRPYHLTAIGILYRVAILNFRAYDAAKVSFYSGC